MIEIQWALIRHSYLIVKKAKHGCEHTVQLNNLRTTTISLYSYTNTSSKNHAPWDFGGKVSTRQSLYSPILILIK